MSINPLQSTSTLNELASAADFLFASRSPFAWEEEKELEKLYTVFGDRLTMEAVEEEHHRAGKEKDVEVVIAE